MLLICNCWLNIFCITFSHILGEKKKAVICETGFVIPVLSPFLCSGFTLEILRWEGRITVNSEQQQIQLLEQINLYLLYNNLMSSPYFRAFIIPFVTALMIGIILNTGYSQGIILLKHCSLFFLHLT